MTDAVKEERQKPEQNSFRLVALHQGWTCSVGPEQHSSGSDPICTSDDNTKIPRISLVTCYFISCNQI